jgi:hypothetical protein
LKQNLTNTLCSFTSTILNATRQWHIQSQNQLWKQSRTSNLTVILTVTSLYILEVISYIKKHKADLIQNINIHNHNKRLNKDYHVNYCRTSLFKRSIINRGN